MQVNKSHFLDTQPAQESTVYLETEFDNYPMGLTKIYKTHDGRRSNENLRSKELLKNSKNKFLNGVKQSSTKDLIQSLKRVASKRLTQRGHKRINNLNPDQKSYQVINNYQNVTASHNKFANKENNSYVSPKKRSKKSVDKSFGNQKLRYAPIDQKPSVTTNQTYNDW